MRDHPATRSRRRTPTMVTLSALILILAACSSSSSTSQAAASQAAASQGSESQAAASQPAASQPAASQPAASQPAASQSPSDGTTVVMSGQSFGVAEITVPVGNVTFVNEDSVPHIIAEGENGSEAASPRITKTTIAGGATAEIAFTQPGDYHITCLIHATMNMEVKVQ
jgi:plastocyanin